jgi:hypothetical protein
VTDGKHTITDLTAGLYRRQYAKFIKGKRINALSLEAEAWFWRVHAAADDFGNADGEPGLVHAATAGRRRVTVEQVTGWLNEMKTEGLIRFYESTGDTYLHVVGFIRKQPAGKNGKRVRHYPESPWDESETRGGNPGESKGIQCSDSDSDSHSDSEDKPATQATAVAAVAARAAAPADESRVVLVFPTVAGRRNKTADWQLRESYVSELSQAFAGLDVPAECRKAHAWVRAKSSNRKTADGMREFLFRWMSRQQDRGGANGHPRYPHRVAAPANRLAQPREDN